VLSTSFAVSDVARWPFGGVSCRTTGTNILYRWKQQLLASSGPVTGTLEQRFQKVEADLQRPRQKRDILKKRWPFSAATADGHLSRLEVITEPAARRELTAYKDIPETHREAVVDIRYDNLEIKHSALEYLTPARFEQLIHHPK
jgi:hypothetical protein